MTAKELEDKAQEKRERALHFFPTYLTHTKGIWAGQKFELLPY